MFSFFLNMLLIYSLEFDFFYSLEFNSVNFRSLFFMLKFDMACQPIMLKYDVVWPKYI